MVTFNFQSVSLSLLGNQIPVGSSLLYFSTRFVLVRLKASVLTKSILLYAVAESRLIRKVLEEDDGELCKVTN